MLTKLTEFTYVTLIKKRVWQELNGPYFSSVNDNIFLPNTYISTYLLRGQLWLGEHGHGSIEKLSLTHQLSHHPGRRQALGGGLDMKEAYPLSTLPPSAPSYCG
jgi:hypothetical protein